MLAELVAERQVGLMDGALISCANYPGCASRSNFTGHASYGCCPSKCQFIWGMRPVLIVDHKGVPVGHDHVCPKAGQEHEAALELAAAHPGSVLLADGGFWAANTEGEGEESLFATLKRQMRLLRSPRQDPPRIGRPMAQRHVALTIWI